ncbi:GLIPR1-like protein 1 [Littorina saxatilis]|uniref:SCP domain-containing protein n=1 Tax=Littorina saxatilis TaxID=31220 RepID=A0AAN9ATH4_9CAEN
MASAYITIATLTRALWVISFLLLTTGHSEETPRLRRALSVQSAGGHLAERVDTSEGRASNGRSEFLDSLLVKRSRERRSNDNKAVTRFSASERLAIVRLHEHYRQSVRPPASDMLTMSWDEQLETMANKFASKCAFEHNPDRDSQTSFKSVGENIYAHSSFYNESAAVDYWHSEEKNYNYNAHSCTGVCGHYTQVVWATSNKIGCGLRYCDPLAKVNFGKGYFIVCNYAPSGNLRGMRPYQQSTAIITSTKKPRDTDDTVPDNAGCSVRLSILLLVVTVYFPLS